MTEFLKGYAAGANDMEAGRLVKRNTDTWLRDTAIDTADELRVQLEAAEAKLAEAHSQADFGRAIVSKLQDALSDAAEALGEDRGTRSTSIGDAIRAIRSRLAEAEKRIKDGMTDDITALRAELERVEKELKNERIERAKSIVSMDRARELAEGQVPIARKEAEWTREATWSDAAIAFDKIARLLGGDDEPK